MLLYCLQRRVVGARQPLSSSFTCSQIANSLSSGGVLLFCSARRRYCDADVESADDDAFAVSSPIASGTDAGLMLGPIRPPQAGTTGVKARTAVRRAYRAKDILFDETNNVCLICRESVSEYGVHCSTSPYHMAYVNILNMFIVHNNAIEPNKIIEQWWPSLRDDKRFFRIPELSAESQEGRRVRIYHLLRFLKNHGVMRHTFNLFQHQNNQKMGGRSIDFEKMEWVGDNVIKRAYFERLKSVAGGRRGYHPLLSFIMGNGPLGDLYDYLEIPRLLKEGFSQTMMNTPVSKLKADVMEVLFGELHTFAWATQNGYGVESHMYPISPEVASLRYIVLHTLNEIISVHVLQTLGTITQRVTPFIAKYRYGIVGEYPRVLKVRRRVGFDRKGGKAVPPPQQSKKEKEKVSLLAVQYPVKVSAGPRKMPEEPFRPSPNPSDHNKALRSGTNILVAGTQMKKRHTSSHCSPLLARYPQRVDIWNRPGSALLTNRAISINVGCRERTKDPVLRRPSLSLSAVPHSHCRLALRPMPMGQQMCLVGNESITSLSFSSKPKAEVVAPERPVAAVVVTGLGAFAFVARDGRTGHHRVLPTKSNNINLL